MHESKTLPRKTHLARAVQGALLIMSLTTATVASAKMAQQTLITKDPTQVEPNLFFTLDDSGSMVRNFVPEKEKDKRVFAIHPGEPSRYYFQIDGVLPTTDNHILSARRRSSKINTIYYDPEVRYLPWRDENGNLMQNADPKRAWYHKDYAGTSTESAEEVRRIAALRLDLTGYQNVGTLRVCAVPQDPDKVCPAMSGVTRIAPATYYIFKGPENPTEADINRQSNYQRVTIADHSSFERGLERDDCALKPGSTTVRVCTQAQEYQNFANWFQYHRTRMHVAIAAIGTAFSALGNDIRVGYGRINKSAETSIDGVNSRVIERGVRRFEGDDRKAFFRWLNNRVSDGATPLLDATNVVGNYFMRRDNNGPWSAKPGSGSKNKHLSCRRNYHLLMTDGLYNFDRNAPTRQRQHYTEEHDNVAGEEMTGPGNKAYRYQPTRPYASSTSGTLADYAMKFWVKDLRPDLVNDVPHDEENPAFWQHLSMYTLSFGVEGTLSQSDWSALKQGTKQWPAKIDPETPETIDDLWHAAINGRGEYVNVQDGTFFLKKIRDMLRSITATRTSGPGGVDVKSQALQNGNAKFVPIFTTQKWIGNLEAVEVDENGNEQGLLWSAVDKLPVPKDRRLFVGNGQTSGARSTAFNWNSLPASVQASMLRGAGIQASAGNDLVSYLRGDRSKERDKTFRERESTIAHIVGSNPTYVGAAIDRGYRFLPDNFDGQASGAKTYRNYVARKATANDRQGTVFIGSNDGILHAFDAKTGVETYGFIPRAVVSEMARSARKDYSARFLVDGPLIERDAYWDNAWRNVLVGTTGAGPKSVFALDVSRTKPAGLGANTVLWELRGDKDGVDDTVGVEPELGHVLATPEVGVTRNGTWVAIFGNGYESASRRAQLFVVDLKTGQVLKRLDTGVGSNARASDYNGLGGVTVQRDGNQVITAVYAGDLLGNVWKFDLSSASPNDWKVALDRKPLFTTVNKRPITAAPALVTHPMGGVMVLFGTGKLFDEGDEKLKDEESVYSVWDKSRLQTDENGKLVWVDGNTIKADSIRRIESTAISAGRYVTVTTKAMDWTKERGWRLPLTMLSVGGQRSILQPQLVTGLALFETMSPVLSTEEADNACRTRINTPGFNLLLDPLSGAMATKAVIDTDGNMIIDSRDQIVAGWQVTDWTGRSVVLTKPPVAPCTSASCMQTAAPAAGTCPPGTLHANLQNVGTGQDLCMTLPEPARWWWREINVPDRTYEAGQLVPAVQSEE